MGTITFKKKEHIGSGNFKYTYECYCSPKPLRNIEVIAGNDNEARTLAQVDCDEYCTADASVSTESEYQLPDPILAGGFRGVVRIRTWENQYVAPQTPFLGSPRPDYDGNPYDWQMLPSRHGGYWIRTFYSPGGWASQSYYYWMTDMRDDARKLVLNPGCDDWETYFIERHPSGAYTLRSYGNQNRFVCAEPSSHGIHMVANREAASTWEQFSFDIVQVGLPDDPPPVDPTPPKQLPYICTNCGNQIAICNGNVVGGKCVYCSSPAGRCKCPHCSQEFYEISHIHTI